MSIDAVAWHDRTLDNHRAETQKAAAAGYRGVSLTIYGSRSDPRYAAVMVRRPVAHAASEWSNMTAPEWQARFGEMAAKGFGPYLISAVGPSGDPLIAAVFRPMATTPMTRHGMTAAEFATLNYRAWCNGLIPASADAYGTPDDTRFIATWHPNTARLAWNLDAMTPSDAVLRQARFNAITAQGARPVFTSMTPGGGQFGLFVDDQVGSWSSRSGIDSASYQAEYNKATAAGRQPVRVAAEGAGSGARFAAIFAEREEPVAREWHAEGPSTVEGIDATMRKFMQAQGMRGCALAITSGSRLVYAKGYTWAEPGYPRTQPTTTFRIASISKLFAAAAMHRLVQIGAKTAAGATVSLDTTMQAVLGLKTPSGGDPVDKRFNDVKIRHLLESTSSLDQGLIWRHVEAAASFGTNLPCKAEQLASFAATLPLGSSAPGDTSNVVYGNGDYFLLSQVVRKLVPGAADFEAALQTLVLTPLGITRVRGSRSLQVDQLPDEARHHERLIDPIQATDKDGKLVFNDDGSPRYVDWPRSLHVDLSSRTPERPLVPHAYGTDNYEILDGCGGLSAAATDIARLLASMNMNQSDAVFSPATLKSWFKAAVEATAYNNPYKHGGFHGLDWAVFKDSATDPLAAGNLAGAKGGWLPSHGSSIQFTIGGFGFVALGNDGGQGDVKSDWYLDPDGDGKYDAQSVLAQTIAQPWGTADLFPNFFKTAFGAVSPGSPKSPSPFQPPAFPSGARLIDALRVSMLKQRASAIRR